MARQILIVDDEESIRRAIAGILQDQDRAQEAAVVAG